MSRPAIQIEYCTSCNYLPRALWIAAVCPSQVFQAVGLVSAGALVRFRPL